MATRKLLGMVKDKVMGTGAELGARVVSKALDAVEAVDRARHDAPMAVRSVARRVPVVGKRLARKEALEPALEEVRRQAGKIARDVKRTTDTPRPRPAMKTKIELESIGPGPEYFKGRKVVTSRGRKTMPAVAAKRVQAKAQPAGFKAKRGQKKKHH